MRQDLPAFGTGKCVPSARKHYGFRRITLNLLFQTSNEQQHPACCCYLWDRRGKIMKEQDHNTMLDELPPKLPQGKDEMNLAEFPLCCIADRAQPDVKTLVFEDQVWDTSRGEKITRQLTITASDEYGLPTARDDEVLLGLVQLSKLNDFADRRV